MENEAIKNILTRHSVRNFTSKAIKKEDLMTLLKAAMSAPSAHNRQPWSFVVVTKREVLDTFSEKLVYGKMLSKASAAIVVCGLPDKSPLSGFWITDCSAASENILLASHGLGYGAVWVAIFPDEKNIKEIKEILKIPEDIIPLNIIALGEPVDKNELPKNKFKEKNIHWENWQA